MTPASLSDQLRSLSDTTADGHETELLVNSAELLDEMLEALRQVEAWWLSNGLTRFDGAPHCMFLVRELASKAGVAPTRTAPTVDSVSVALANSGTACRNMGFDEIDAIARVALDACAGSRGEQ